MSGKGGGGGIIQETFDKLGDIQIPNDSSSNLISPLLSYKNEQSLN